MRKFRLILVSGLLFVMALLAAGTAAAGGWASIVSWWYGDNWGAGITAAPIDIDDGIILVQVPVGLNEMTPRASQIIGSQTIEVRNPTQEIYVMDFWPSVRGVSGGYPNIQLLISYEDQVVRDWEGYTLLRIPAGFSGHLQLTLRIAPWGSAGESWEKLYVTGIQIYLPSDSSETPGVGTTPDGVTTIPPEEIGEMKDGGTYVHPMIEVDGKKIYP